MKRLQDLKILDKDFDTFQNYISGIEKQMQSTFTYRYSIIECFTNNIENTIFQIRKNKVQQQQEITNFQEQIVETQMWIDTKRTSIDFKKQEISHCEKVNQTLEERISIFKKQQERLFEFINHNKSDFDNQNTLKNNIKTNSNVNNNNGGRKSILIKKNATKNPKKQQNQSKNVEFDLENNKMIIRFTEYKGQENFMELHYRIQDDKFLLSNYRKNINYAEKLQGLIQEFNTHQNLKELYKKFVQLIISQSSH